MGKPFFLGRARARDTSGQASSQFSSHSTDLIGQHIVPNRHFQKISTNFPHQSLRGLLKGGNIARDGPLAMLVYNGAQGQWLRSLSYRLKIFR